MPTIGRSFIGIAGREGEQSIEQSLTNYGIRSISGASDGEARATRQPSAASADLAAETADDDYALMELSKEFEQIAGQLQKLRSMSSEDDCLGLTEAMLGRLEPIERAIMETPARTVVGLGVKARHAAHVMSEYWTAPIDRIDWDARAIRLLIEAVCEFAGMQLPPEEGPSP